MKKLEFDKIPGSVDERLHIEATDDRENGSHHHYQIIGLTSQASQKLVDIRFQKGELKNSAPNGCTMESLIRVVVDRLQDFQEGEHSCRENAIAITHLETALLWLDARQRRMRDG